MSLRFFENEDHAKVYVQYRPSPPLSLVQRLLSFIREKYDGPLDLAIDLGCGNGQCTFALSKHFTSVLGTDISPAQIAEAREVSTLKKYENVKFEAAPAEQIPVTEKSVQLITICEAAHWMDLTKVFAEASRVLCPGGVLAIIGYHLPKYEPCADEDKEKADAINEVIDKGVEETKPYWPKQAFVCFTEYSDVTIPFSKNVRERGFLHKRTARIADILGCIRTYSPYVTYCKEKGEQTGTQLLDGIGNSIASILNEGREKELTPEEIKSYQFTETFNYFVLMARN